MDVITAIKLYINKMTNESGPGMKILLMDKETVSSILVYEKIINQYVQQDAVCIAFWDIQYFREFNFA